MGGNDTGGRHGVEASPELVAIAERWMQAFETRNGQVLTALFSHTNAVRYVGSDADEIFKGELLREGYTRHVAEIPDFRADCKELEAFACGEVGWAIWLGSLHFVERDVRFPYRFSLVFSLEAGIWKMVHIHVSTPRSNVEVMGAEHFVFQQLMQAAKAESEMFGVEGTSTIMFTDVVNSTSLAAFAGDRAWSKVISRHFDEIRSIVEDHDGVVVKTLGDGTMSSFMSARAAMQAAQAIQLAVAKDGAEPMLQLRIGLHSGDVVQAEGDFFGSVVNKAARIAAIAEPGSIFVSEAARAMAEEGSGLAFETLKPVALRGIDGRHHICRLLMAD